MKKSDSKSVFLKSCRWIKSSMTMFILCLTFIAANAQQKTVTGTVSDNNGEPLIGATVSLEGSTTGTITDVDGKFAINAAPGQILLFSYLGMQNASITVGDNSEINVSLQTSAVLEEVVVVGYGTTKKSDVISSVSSVKPEDLTKVATSDIGEMLRGKAAGVLVTLANGGPGSSSNILIRGQNSINGGNSPIIIVDGVPVGNINDINANDIASMEILKDAASQSIYGARASNGVILITTKRGKEGKTKVSYNGASGTQTINRNFDIYSGEEFAQLKREAFRSANLGNYPADEDIMSQLELASINSGKFINWEDEILRTGTTHNHNLSIASGTDKTNVYTSFNLFDQDGVIDNSDYTRITGRVNLDQRVNSWFKVGMNTSFQYAKGNSPNVGGVLLTSITTSPLGEIYNEDGSLRYLPGGFEENKNPLIDIQETNTLDENRNDIFNIFVDLSPIRNFNYRLNLSRRSWNGKSRSYNTSESVTGITNGGLGRGSIVFQDNVEYQIENIVSYTPTLGGKNNLALTAVQSVTESKYNRFANNAVDLPNDILGIYGLEAAATNNPFISGTRRGLLSFAARAEYNYGSKYYFNVAGRTDASTVFGANNKWGFFPSVGIGWNAHLEPFLKNVSALNLMKVRATYGSVGNEGIAPYQSLSSALQRDYIVNGTKVSGYVPGDFLPNPELKWETSTKMNAAVDLGFFNNRVTSTIEYYKTRTTDLLIDQALNAGLGYTRKKTNLGEVENQGIEFSLNTALIRKADFNLNVGGSISRNRNKIISLYGLDEDGDGREDDDVGNRWFIGQPINVHYQYMGVGIFQEGEDIASSHQPNAKPGDIKLFDRFPDDGVLNAKNDRVLTQAGPDWFGNFNVSLNYKSFDISADVISVQGVTRYNTFLVGYSEGGSLRGIKNGIKQNYWLPENPSGTFPRPNEANDPVNLFANALQDASYTRLQNVTIGYTLPKSFMSSKGLSNFRIYATGSNLITITDYQSYSPEKNPNEYPEAVTFVGGLQISF
ncbi:MAG: TonB-dependent receptor [Saprospiraceae bacterium]|nr:TonB-dependent receptor [Saprospiraceae bacterium]